MEKTDEVPRGVEFDDDLLADVPLDRTRADKVVGARRAEAKAKSTLP